MVFVYIKHMPKIMIVFFLWFGSWAQHHAFIYHIELQTVPLRQYRLLSEKYSSLLETQISLANNTCNTKMKSAYNNTDRECLICYWNEFTRAFLRAATKPHLQKFFVQFLLFYTARFHKKKLSQTYDNKSLK